ncbi:pyrroline-5-carboxylate reductase [Kluyveromyces marxianus]|uniref:Pyrroline-5-carboxylate reductase n=1 Tax=Kluyveromyces marxianus TaxID=4911 RepID=A0ABX6EXN9_KLUMA|nr:pyrroline-5-carboxylate reductase [Kluyveromyces marxianus]
MGYTLAIVGCGVMGQALLSAIYNAPKAEESLAEHYPSKIIACNESALSSSSVEKLVKGFGKSPNGIEVEIFTARNVEAVKQSSVVILAVKPYLAEKVMEEIKPEGRGPVLISLAAGVTLSQLTAYFPNSVRVMTNTPAKFGYGTAVVSYAEAVSESNKTRVKELVRHVGTCLELPEKNMDAATALVGSGPAFALLIIESMMEAGLKMGIPLKESRECAIKVLEGTAKMVEITGESPGALKHQVCTPGGTTIAGLCVMEDKGVKSGIIRGIEEAARVATELGQGKKK